jgi:hypothetical protein
MSPDTSFEQSFDYPRGGADAFMDSISSLPMPRRSASDSENDSDSEDESSLGLVLDRSATSSTVSLEPFERLDALQKANAELSRKLVEADRALQNKLTEHDNDLEEIQARLEELKTELTATKREEKELRAKEVCVTFRPYVANQTGEPIFHMHDTQTAILLACQLDANDCPRKRDREIAKESRERTYLLPVFAEAIPGTMRSVLCFLTRSSDLSLD